MTQPDNEDATQPKQRDRLGRFLFWIFGPPTANDAISVHSPQGKAYLARQRAAREREREARRRKRDESR
ncbi:hypothetical protein HC031_28210 [Planosporangium thailandense]|uniref:Uncharacterized protein n=1 Tax=Planosporangium thailandense TaxID=765197 RepID=A0ABX0Y5A4_9ACTN|nr:hypothetical protein [Planosporangium thailandense]NJC73581.1 hypothetical protein [Planosporangium thailandense]